MTQKIDVRRFLARSTRQAHEALHVHPWLSRLSAPDLTVWVYADILQAYAEVHLAVEASRLRAGVNDRLGLAGRIAALRSDLAAMGRSADLGPTSALARTRDSAAALAALYVLHGAGFGGRVLSAHVAESLPDAPRRFLTMGTSAPLWRALTMALQDHAADERALRRMQASAEATFALVATTVSRHCSASGHSGAAFPDAATTLRELH